ncbi:MAG: hypothetical protein ACRD0K_12595 [Egibacteraceae bacterium]
MGIRGERHSGSAEQGRVIICGGVRIIFPPCHTRWPIRLTGERATLTRAAVACPTCECVWTVRFLPTPPSGELTAWWRQTR